MQINARCPHQTILITQGKKEINYESLNLIMIIKHTMLYLKMQSKYPASGWAIIDRPTRSLPACAILHVYLAGNLSVSPPIGFCPINSSHAPPFKRYFDTAAPALPLPQTAKLPSNMRSLAHCFYSPYHS